MNVHRFVGDVRSTRLNLECPGKKKKMKEKTYLIILADGQRAHLVLLTQLLAQRRRHDLATLVGGGVEVRLAALTTAAGDVRGELHLGSLTRSCAMLEPRQMR